ncbi:MAG: nucleoside deaminase [Bacilli bacterium]|jgi:guanine deaminase
MAKKANEELMEMAIKQARKTMNKNYGGPFGAAIIDEKGKVVAISSNTVLKDNDPTAHAEINAIRQATTKMKTYDLSNCILFTTAFPCPMCLGAIIWSNIKTVYYGCDVKQTNEIGFRDEKIYDFLKSDCKNINILKLSIQDQEKCLELFKEYKESNKKIY